MEIEVAPAPQQREVGGRILSPQVQAGVKRLDIDPSNERFMMLVDDMLRSESLPRGWTSKFNDEEGKWVWTDKNGRQWDKHPVHDYYIGAMFMDRGGYAKLKQLAAERPPTADETKQMGLYLNIKEEEDPYLWQVAEMALSAPLPPEWEEVLEGSPEAPQVSFRNKETRESIQEHPLDNYFRELLRRRRKELVRRKKAALKALQAVVRMGGARRSLFANLMAQNKAAGGGTAAAAQPEQEQDDLDFEAMSPAVQSSLQTAWQGLLGSAATMVKSLQAAKWPGSSKHKHRKAAAAAEAANQQRLQQLCDRLTTALDSNVAAGADAAVTLQEIEHLAAQAKTTSSDPDKMAQVLSDRGIVIVIGDQEEGERNPPLSQISRSASHGRDASHCGTPRYRRSESGKSAARSEPSLSKLEPDHPEQTGDAAAAAAAAAGDEGSCLLQRASMTPLQQRQEDNANNKVSFLRISTVGSDPGPGGKLSTLFPTHGLSPAGNSGSGAYANIGPYSSSGGGYDWSLSGGCPTPASSATAQKIRAYAALARQTQEEAVFKTALDAVAAEKAQLDPDRDPDCAAEPVQGSPLRDKALDPNGQRSQSYRVQTGSAQTVDTVAEPGPRQQSRLGFFLGMGDLPPLAEVALQHISMLQAVVEEATSLIKAWQQQGLLIVLLQQLLAAAAAELEAGQARLTKVLIELDQVKQAQQQQSDATAAASAEHLNLLQQLEQANKDLQTSRADAQQTQLGHDELQKLLEAALAAAGAAGVQQQQLEVQLAAVKQQLQQEQEARQQQEQQLVETEAELARLQAGHAQQMESSGTEVAATASQLSQMQSKYQILKQEHAKLQDSLTQGLSAASAADNQQQQLAQQLLEGQHELTVLKGAYAELQELHAQLQTRYDQQGQELAGVQTQYSALQEDHQQQSSELSTARELIHRLQIQHEESGGDLSTAQAEAARLQAELETVKQHSRQLEQHGQQLEQQRDGLQQREQQLQQEQLCLQDQLSNHSKQLADLAQQLAVAQQQCQQLEQEKQQLQAQLSGGSKGLAVASQQLAETQQQLHQVEGQKQQLQEQLGHSSKELASVSEQLAQTQQQLQQERQHLQKQLDDSSKELTSASQQSQQQLQQLEQEKQQSQQQLGDSRKQLASVSQQLAQTQQQSQQLEQEKQRLQQQFGDSSKELASLSQKLAQTQQQLQQERQQLQESVDGYSKELASVSQQLALAQQQSQLLEQVKQQLQAQAGQQDKQLIDLREQLQETLRQLHQTQQQLVHVQQEHQKLQQQYQQSQQQLQQLQAQNEKALEDQIKLMDVKADLMKQIKDLKAAAEAAEKQRLSKPSKVCQITAADADQQHWTNARSVQTGEELDPRSKRDVGTPADLSLLSYFFREIKQKQRGGGGAIIGYDPDSAREAATAAGSPPTSPGKSWTGGSLPGIQVEAKRAVSMPGTIRAAVKQSMPSAKKLPEEEVQDGNLDLRPVPFEVKNRVDRRRDREMKLEREPRGAGDRWDYAADERDTEIAELKKRLVEQDRKHREAASKTEEEAKTLTMELQSFKHSTDLLQTDNFTLRKELASLRSAMQAVGMPVPGSPDTSTSGARQSLFGPRASVMLGQQGSPGRTSVFAQGSPGRHSLFSGGASRPKTTGSSESSNNSSVGGARLSMAGAGSVPLPGSSGSGGHQWGSAFGSLGSNNPGILAGGASVSGSGTPSTPLSPRTEKGVQFLSLSGVAGVHFPGVADQAAAKGSASPRAQHLVPTLRSGTGNSG